MKKERKKLTPEERAADEVLMRKLEERSAYHEAKLAENDRPAAKTTRELTASESVGILRALMLLARI